VEPHHDLGSQASPSRMRSPNHEVAAQTLADDARMAIPLLAVDSRMATPPPTTDTRMETLPPAADTRMATPPLATDTRGRRHRPLLMLEHMALLVASEHRLLLRSST
jgi:hypothetical protein